MQLPEFSPYLFEPNEVYSSKSSFDETVDLLKEISETRTDANYPLTENILVIQIPEGVFIRAGTFEWCTALTELVKNPSAVLPSLTIIPKARWNEMTIKYRGPIESFGDERLVRWRIGFGF